MDINLVLQELGLHNNNYRLSTNADDGSATIVFWDSTNTDASGNLVSTPPTPAVLTAKWNEISSNYNANIDPSPSTGIADDSVTTAKIADDAVTTDKLADSINTAITANTSKLTADTTNVANAGAVMDGDFTSNGFMKRTGVGTYEVDANTYLTSIPSSYLQNVSEDSSPQLAANLDVQTHEINTSTSNGNIILNPNGTGVVEIKGDGSSADGTLQLNCSQNSHGVKIASPPHSANASYTLTLPSSDGETDQVLKTNGNGGLDWVDQNTVDSTKMPLTGGTFTGSVTFEDAINENVYAITDPTDGSSVDLDPDNGMIQTWTLGGNRTATESLTAGQSMLLVVTAGSYTLTFPTITWVGGTAPTLSTSKPTAIEFWKVATTLYGANVGDLG